MDLLTTITKAAIENMAEVCHEANRAFCKVLGDNTQKPWDECEQWQKDSAIAGVEFRLANPGAPPSAQHEAWRKQKIEDGWVFGEIKDATEKTHPCMVDYDFLPIEQQAKDKLFQNIVDALIFKSSAACDIKYQTAGQREVGISDEDNPTVYAINMKIASIIDDLNYIDSFQEHIDIEKSEKLDYIMSVLGSLGRSIENILQPNK